MNELTQGIRRVVTNASLSLIDWQLMSSCLLITLAPINFLFSHAPHVRRHTIRQEYEHVRESESTHLSAIPLLKDDLSHYRSALSLIFVCFSLSLIKSLCWQSSFDNMPAERSPQASTALRLMLRCSSRSRHEGTNALLTRAPGIVCLPCSAPFSAAFP